MNIIFRVRYMTAPSIPHVYCRVFAAVDGGTFAAMGSLTMRQAEFGRFQELFQAEFIREETELRV